MTGFLIRAQNNVDTDHGTRANFFLTLIYCSILHQIHFKILLNCVVVVFIYGAYKFYHNTCMTHICLPFQCCSLRVFSSHYQKGLLSHGQLAIEVVLP